MEAAPDSGKKPDKVFLYGGIAVAVIAVFMILAHFVYQDDAAWKEWLENFLSQARGTPWALPLVCVAYVFGSLVFFPIVLMNFVCAVVFGLWGIAYALIGCMLNASVYYGLGHFLRNRPLGKKLLKNPKIAKVDEKLKNIGLAGVVMIHLLPAPPFVVTNFVSGMSSITFVVFFAGTLISMLPGAIGRGIVGDSLSKIILEPSPETWLYLGIGIVIWGTLVAGMHVVMKKYQPVNAQ